MKSYKTTTLWIFISFLFIFHHGISQSTMDSFYYGLPVLPNAHGYGLDTPGGKGGEIIKVSNLNKDGAGSLSKALETKGPRIVVFEVAGVIDLNGNSLLITDPFITIAGQTAPYPGITLIKGGLRIQTHDVIVQHIKVRPGEAGNEKKSGWEVDGISTSNGAYNVIVDHCSITWSTDENLSASGSRFKGSSMEEWRENTSHKIVFSNCLVAEGLSNSTHRKGEHSKGSLIHDNATDILIVGNLYADNMRRNPYCKGGTQVTILNNYIYNPGAAAIHYGLMKEEWTGHEWVTGKLVVSGNTIEFANNTRNSVAGGSFHGPVEVFWQDNLLLGKDKMTETKGDYISLKEAPFWPEGYEIQPTEKVKESVLKNAGAFPWKRDGIDKRIIADIQAHAGKIIDSENEVGGYPTYEPVYQAFIESQWDLTTMTRKPGK